MTVDELKAALISNGAVTVRGFGTFKIKVSKARNGVNPMTGDPLVIPEKKKVSFRPTAAFKEEVNS
jgi:nucleoid DNA-binding protein